LQRLRGGDEAAYVITFMAAASILAITGLLVLELYTNSSLSRAKFGWSFLATSTWDPVNDQFGALPFIYGTVVTSFLALLMGIPLGVGAAIFLAELAPPKISDGLTFLIELLAAVPSVIYGLLGVFVLIPILRDIEPYLKAALGWTPFFAGTFYGVSLFSAGVVLAVMIILFIISIRGTRGPGRREAVVRWARPAGKLLGISLCPTRKRASWDRSSWHWRAP
jgi:phosphate transport system permease protein